MRALVWTNTNPAITTTDNVCAARQAPIGEQKGFDILQASVAVFEQRRVISKAFPMVGTRSWSSSTITPAYGRHAWKSGQAPAWFCRIRPSADRCGLRGIGDDTSRS